MRPNTGPGYEEGGEKASTDLESTVNLVMGGGQPLDAGLQRSMRQTMGTDFTGVWVHTDTEADQLNQSIQAKALMTGQDVFFRQRAYQPGSRGGQELIVHELTHVAQQLGTNSSSSTNVIQRFITEYKNTETKRDFTLEVSESGGAITIQEIFPGKQRGRTTYEKKGDHMLLHTINVKPQEGSGIGGLLMFYLASIALEQECKVIEIQNPAISAVGFYEHMGAKAYQPEKVIEYKKMYSDKDSQLYWKQIVTEAAESEYEKNNYEKDDYKDLTQLPRDEKEMLIDKKTAEMDKLDLK